MSRSNIKDKQKAKELSNREKLEQALSTTRQALDYKQSLPEKKSSKRRAWTPLDDERHLNPHFFHVIYNFRKSRVANMKELLFGVPGNDYERKHKLSASLIFLKTHDHEIDGFDRWGHHEYLKEYNPVHFQSELPKNKLFLGVAFPARESVLNFGFSKRNARINEKESLFFGKNESIHEMLEKLATEETFSPKHKNIFSLTRGNAIQQNLFFGLQNKASGFASVNEETGSNKFAKYGLLLDKFKDKVLETIKRRFVFDAGLRRWQRDFRNPLKYLKSDHNNESFLFRHFDSEVYPFAILDDVYFDIFVNFAEKSVALLDSFTRPNLNGATREDLFYAFFNGLHDAKFFHAQITKIKDELREKGKLYDDEVGLRMMYYQQCDEYREWVASHLEELREELKSFKQKERLSQDESRRASKQPEASAALTKPEQSAISQSLKLLEQLTELEISEGLGRPFVTFKSLMKWPRMHYEIDTKFRKRFCGDDLPDRHGEEPVLSYYETNLPENIVSTIEKIIKDYEASLQALGDRLAPFRDDKNPNAIDEQKVRRSLDEDLQKKQADILFTCKGIETRLDSREYLSRVTLEFLKKDGSLEQKKDLACKVLSNLSERENEEELWNFCDGFLRDLKNGESLDAAHLMRYLDLNDEVNLDHPLMQAEILKKFDLRKENKVGVLLLRAAKTGNLELLERVVENKLDTVSHFILLDFLKLAAIEGHTNVIKYIFDPKNRKLLDGCRRSFDQKALDKIHETFGDQADLAVVKGEILELVQKNPAIFEEKPDYYNMLNFLEKDDFGKFLPKAAWVALTQLLTLKCDQDIIALFIKELAGLNNPFYEEYLTAAIKNNNLEVVKILIGEDRKGEFNNHFIFMANLNRFMEIAIDSGSEEVLQFLVDKLEILKRDDFEESRGGKPFYGFIKKAVKLDRLDILEDFIQKLPNPSNESIILHCAYELKKGNAVKLIANKRPAAIQQIILWKIENGDFDITEYVVDQIETFDLSKGGLLQGLATTIRDHSQEGQEDQTKKQRRALARKILGKAINLDCADEQGKTILMHAADLGLITMVKFLVERGADVTLFDKEWRNALDYSENYPKTNQVIGSEIKKMAEREMAGVMEESWKALKLLGIKEDSHEMITDIIEKNRTALGELFKEEVGEEGGKANEESAPTPSPKQPTSDAGDRSDESKRARRS